MSKGRIALCPHCGKKRRDESPYAYVWWHVLRQGLMCWKCYEKHKSSSK